MSIFSYLAAQSAYQQRQQQMMTFFLMYNVFNPNNDVNIFGAPNTQTETENTTTTEAPKTNASRDKINLGNDIIADYDAGIFESLNIDENDNVIISKYASKELALEFFDKMQFDDGKDEKFFAGAINTQLSAANETSTEDQETKALLLAIKASDANKDGITTKEELIASMENKKGLEIEI